MKRAISLFIGCAPALGFTECDEFSTVTVPISDTSPPLVATRYLLDGELAFAGDAVLEVQDLGASFYVFPFTSDLGGPRDLFVDETLTFSCSQPNGPGLFVEHVFPGQHDIQFAPGGGFPPPGTQVSDGIYLVGQVRSLADWAWLCQGMVVEYAIYSWSFDSYDMHQNYAQDQGQLSYFRAP